MPSRRPDQRLHRRLRGGESADEPHHPFTERRPIQELESLLAQRPRHRRREGTFKDGERVIAAFSMDPRASGDIGRVAEDAKPAASAEPEPPPLHALAVTSDGYSLRFSLAGFVEPSTRSGRRYARVPDGAEVVSVATTTGEETVIAATKEARAMLCSAEEVNFLSGPGRGVILIELNDDDRVIGAIVSRGDRDLMTVETSRGAEQIISTGKYEVTGRGGKGRELMQRAQFVRMLPQEVSLPVLPGGD